MPWTNDERTLMLEKGPRGNGSRIYNPASLVARIATRWAGAGAHPAVTVLSALGHPSCTAAPARPSSTRGIKPNQPTKTRSKTIFSLEQQRYSAGVPNGGRRGLRRSGWAWRRVPRETRGHDRASPKENHVPGINSLRSDVYRRLRPRSTPH